MLYKLLLHRLYTRIYPDKGYADIFHGQRYLKKRLSLTPMGNIRNQLKMSCSDESTHVMFEPLDFIAKLAAHQLEFLQ